MPKKWMKMYPKEILGEVDLKYGGGPVIKVVVFRSLPSLFKITGRICKFGGRTIRFVAATIPLIKRWMPRDGVIMSEVDPNYTCSVFPKAPPESRGHHT